MRTRIWIGLALLVMFGFAMQTSMSTAANHLPPGSYQKTCRNIKVTANGIYAECKTRDGRWVKTGLSSSALPCNDIENDNGELVCVGG